MVVRVQTIQVTEFFGTSKTLLVALLSHRAGPIREIAQCTKGRQVALEKRMVHG